MPCRLLFTLICLAIHALLVGPVAAQTPLTSTGELDKDSERQIAEITRRLSRVVEAKFSSEPIPLAEFLAKLEDQLPKDQKVSLRIDADAFGKNAAEVAKASIEFRLRRKTTLGTILRWTIAFTDSDQELDFRIYPTHFAITTRQHAMYLAAHEIRDLVRDVIPKLRKMGPVVRDVWDGSFDVNSFKAGQEAEFLTKLVMGTLEQDTPAIMVENRNNAQLVIQANYRDHSKIADALNWLRRLADLAVVMNARLLEVDKKLFDQRLAPMFAGSKERPEGRTLARADDSLVKILNKQKVILREEPLKIIPGQSEVFLALYKPFQILGLNKDRRPEISQLGVGFSVKAAISDDRRRLELKITQSVSELIDIKKTKVLDVKTGNEIETEVPNVLNRTLTGSLVIWDRQPIVMPVGYRSADAKKQNRLWVLLAEPAVYIQEEQEYPATGTSIPEPQAEKAPITKRPPSPEKSEKVEQILHAVINHLLTNEEFKGSREYQNHTGQIKFRLVDGEKVAWPDWLHPAVPGFTQVFNSRTDPDNLELNPGRVLDIRLDQFDLSQLKWTDFDTPIEVNFHNPAFMRGLSVHYVPKREGERWTVEMYGAHSP